MTAGARNVRVTLQSAAGSNSLGEVTDTWTALGSRWAQRLSMQQRERYVASRDVGMVDVVYRLPYDSVTSALVPKNRLLEGSTVYDITGAEDETGLRREITVTAKRVDV